MFDYQTSKHAHFDAACRAFALTHNLEDVAAAVGMRPQLLRNKLNPLQPHRLTCDELLAITDHTEDARLLDGMLAQINCLPSVPVNNATEGNMQFCALSATASVGAIAGEGTLNEQAASDALKKHEQSRNHPDATTGAKGFVQLSSATDSTSEALAATPKALKIAMDNANARLAKDRNGADIPNPALFIQNIGLQQTVDLAKGAVPSTRRVNGKALSGDIEIFPSDIYAGSVGRINPLSARPCQTEPACRIFSLASSCSSNGRKYRNG
ncbi:phage regulatory CII family protein [Escherichia coli]